MVDLSNFQNSWTRPEPQEWTADEEPEICVGDETDKLGIAPTNYVHISKQGPWPVMPVEGQFVLDPSLLPLPPSPGIASDTARKNLTLHTVSGPITAEVWIKCNKNTEPKRVSLDLFSGNGLVRAIVHDILPGESTRTLPFLDMEMCANFGDIYVSLPRCFRGPITIRTRDDRIAFSPALKGCTALVSDIAGILVYFVGEGPRSGKWGEPGSSNNGETVEDSFDRLLIRGRFSSVRINWDGEEELPLIQRSSWQEFCGGAERFFTIGRVY